MSTYPPPTERERRSGTAAATATPVDRGTTIPRCPCTNRVPTVRWMAVVYGLVICSLLGVMYWQRRLDIGTSRSRSNSRRDLNNHRDSYRRMLLTNTLTKIRARNAYLRPGHHDRSESMGVQDTGDGFGFQIHKVGLCARDHVTSFILAGDPDQHERRRRSSRPPCVVLAILSLSILTEDYAAIGTFLRRHRGSRRERDVMAALQTRASSHTCGLSFGRDCIFGTRRLPKIWWRGVAPFHSHSPRKAGVFHYSNR